MKILAVAALIGSAVLFSYSGLDIKLREAAIAVYFFSCGFMAGQA